MNGKIDAVSVKNMGDGPANWNSILDEKLGHIITYDINGVLGIGAPVDAYPYGILITFPNPIHRWSRMQIYLPDRTPGGFYYRTDDNTGKWHVIRPDEEVASKTS